MKKNKLSTIELALFSTGGMIGCGWLFSPFYGFQTAGVWVIISWLIAAILTFVIALSFAEVSCMLPIVGGVSRFIGVTHNKTIAFIFLALNWISLAVYLPLEAQSAIQYLGFWCPTFVNHTADKVVLSHHGLILAVLIIIFLTWLNSFLIKNITKINSAMGIWKMIIPVGVALIFISFFGSLHHIVHNYNRIKFSFEHILLAITSSGLAFAFTGFQNSLVMAHTAKKPKTALPVSLFSPIVLGVIIYMLLSLTFICCLSDPSKLSQASVAPLLALAGLFGLNIVYIILFADAILAPLGTANVYTAVTARVLFGLAQDFLPNSILTRLNRHQAPSICLWVSGIFGMGFLLPLPTWTQLVDFLSSIVIFSYIAGPIALIVLRREFPHLKRDFRVKGYQMIGYLGFICCSLLVYWSGFKNLEFLFAATVIILLGYVIIKQYAQHKLANNNPPPHTNSSIVSIISDSKIIILYLLALLLVSFCHQTKLIAFPVDNLCIIMLAIIFCKLLVYSHAPYHTIQEKIQQLNLEVFNANLA